MKNKPDDTDIARDNWLRYQEMYDATEHGEYVKLANECDRFYSGDQWDEETLQNLGDRPALTLNMSLRAINAIKGQYSKNKADIVVKPKNGATDEQAKTLTLLIGHILDTNDYSFVEQQVFDDGIVVDRGFLDVRMSYDDNVLGEVRVTSRDPRTVVLDPTATDYDPSTWNEVVITDWYSIDDITALYGEDKAEQLRRFVDLGQYNGEESIRFGGTRAGRTWSNVQSSDAIRVVRVIDRQYRRLALVREFVDLDRGDTRPVPAHWDEDRVQAVAEEHGLAIRRRMVKRVRWTVTADNVVLFDDWSPYDDFTVVPFFPYFRRGRPTGVMRHLLSPQQQLNKAESQELHIINTTSNSGWMIEAGSLVNMTEEELEQRGAETGLVLVYGRNRPAPKKIEPNHVPTGIDRLAIKAASYVNEIPGVAPLVAQQADPSVSGVAVQRTLDVAASGLQPIFDNLSYTRTLLARRIMSLIQRFYTEPRVYQLTSDGGPEKDTRLEINTSFVNNVTIGKYGVKVTSVPARDSFDEAQFSHLLELRNAGVMIPDHYIIQHAPIEGRDKIADEVKRMQGLGDPDPQQAQMAQMQQQMAIQQMQAELAALQAKAENMAADAELAKAKAGATVLNAQTDAQKLQFTMQQERDKLVADLRKTIATLQNKLELAQIHSQSKAELTRYNRVAKLTEAEAQARKEQDNNGGKPT